MIAYTLNLFDLACTMYALENGVEELNPLMRNVPFMIFYKVIVMYWLLVWLAGRKEKVAKYGMAVMTVVYTFVAVWHCASIIKMQQQYKALPFGAVLF